MGRHRRAFWAKQRHVERQDRGNEHGVGRGFLLGTDDSEGWRENNYLRGHKAAIPLVLTQTLGSKQQMRKQKFRVVQTPNITCAAAESGHKPGNADSQSSAHPGPECKRP